VGIICGVRLHVLSDLHLEQRPDIPPAVEADVLVLAGDIATGTDGVRWARDWSQGRPTLYVAGNHEYYGHAIPELTDRLRDAADGSAVHVLEDDEVVVNGVRFLGCTLWSDFDADGAENRERSMRVCARVVNDFRHVRFDGEDRTFAPGDARRLHLRSRSWLEERLGEPHDGDTVVITHHAPMLRGGAPPGPMRAIAGAFASDLSALMGGDRAKLWIFGHTHRAADTDVRGTRVLSNPRGYAHEPVAEFDPSCVVDV
jgi:3',5'-cyclic AMP phosphodiesterase CpdA